MSLLSLSLLNERFAVDEWPGTALSFSLGLSFSREEEEKERGEEEIFDAA